MGKNYVESSLKRFLKKRVRITLGLVVTFLITGMTVFAEGTGAEEENKPDISKMNNYEKAEYFLQGLGKSNIKAGEYKDSTGKYIITVADDGKISFAGFDTNQDGTADTNIPEVANTMISKVVSELLQNAENGALASNEITVTDNKKAPQINTGILTGKSGQTQDIEGLENYGFIIAQDRGQYSWAGKNRINYGIIIKNGSSGGAQTMWGRNTSKKIGLIENYGVIISKGYGQQFSNSSTNSIGYNFGYIQGEKGGQVIDNYDPPKGTTTDFIIMDNYGIINSTLGNAQQIASTEALPVTNSQIINHGLLTAQDKVKFAQSVTGATNRAENYGIIKGSNNNLVEVKDGATAYNNGIIINEAGTGIFDNKTGKNENVVNEGMLVVTGDNVTENFVNKGVVLNSDFELIAKDDANGINKNVHQFNDRDKITNNDVNDKTSGYIKNGSAEITENLIGKNLNAVVTADSDFTKDKAVFTYENADNTSLQIINSDIVGYFQKAGTLLDVKSGEKFTIAGDTLISAIKDKGLTSEDVTTVKLSNGAILETIGNAQIVGSVVGDEAGIAVTAGNGGKVDDNKVVKIESDRKVKTVLVSNVDNDLISANIIKAEDNYTNVEFRNSEIEDFKIEFENTAEGEKNKIVLGENVVIKNGIDGSKTTEGNDLNLEISDISNVGGDIKLGASDDNVTVYTNEKYDKIVDLGAGNDSLTVNGFAKKITKAEDVNEAQTFNYKVAGVETITLKGQGNGTAVGYNNSWNIGEDAEIVSKGENGTVINLENTKLNIELNNDCGKGEVTTSLDKLAGENGENNLKIQVTDQDNVKNEGVNLVIGDKFDVAQKEFSVNFNYSFDKGITKYLPNIFKGQVVSEKEVKLTVKEASELGLAGYEAVYNAALKGISKDDDLRNAVNYQKLEELQKMIKGIGNTAEAFYTTGYAVTKDVADTYMSVVEDFGRKAGAGEWIAYGKYVNSDTEFDGGKASKGYDGDINGTVGMIEYGVNDTTSYGVVYGQGNTEVNINGGGKLDGDNTYFGGYVKHRTQKGIDLVGNIGITKSELDLKLATKTSMTDYNIITDGKSDADALTFALRGTKDYKLSDSVKVQPVVSAKYSFITQDEVTSSDANFKMEEQDVTIFEGSFGGNVIKDFELSYGTLSLSAGAEYVLTNVNTDENARYSLYSEDLHFTGEEDIADNRIEGHIGAEYIHENGVGFNAKYEMIWTNEGDTDRVTAGVSYKF